MKFQTKIALAMSGVLILILSLTVYLFFEKAHHVQRESLRSRLVGIATTAAMMIDPEELDRLRIPADEARPEYQEIKEQLRSIRRNPDVRAVYTMRRTAGPSTYEFIVDSDEDADNNHNGVLEPDERYGRIGEHYATDKYPELQRAFDGPIADRELNSDRWGNWLSGYAPIRDARGQAVAILGVDMAANDVRREERILEVAASSTLALGVLASILVSSLLARRLTRPLAKLEAGIEAVTKGNLETRVTVESGDEIGCLGAMYNEMIAALADAKEQIDDQTRTLERRIAEKTQELQRTREAAIESEKLAALGIFSGGIAHEFNNIICAVRGQVELAALSPTRERIQKAVETVAACADRSRRITDALQTFSRRGPLRLHPTDVQTTVETALDLFKGDLNANNISVTRKFSEVETIGAEPERLVQAFGNVIANARDAMRDQSGRLTVIIRPVDQDIEVAFRDTGPGIPVETLSHLFEPFYTTKGPPGSELSLHTGLGLAVAHGVAKSHGGEITAENNEGGGATIRIRLPVRQWAGVGQRHHPLRQPVVQTRRVLVVDDEPDILSAVRDFLVLRGWEVETAASGDEALEKASRSTFPLYLVDIAIPGVSGIDLIRKLRERHPSSVFVVISGFASDQLASRLEDGDVAAFVSKPFTVDDLAATLESLVATRDAAAS